ncbi:transporter substrate-binding domain-containing protein [Paraburkholderia nemoris]|uniref:transporter substrate-binding domain-containing protein n=1 Tax=Paraburkholderia nemoris TaxID=2793076 RepID=UPI0038BA7FA9
MDFPSDLKAALKELAPTGKLRIGVVFAPAVSTFFVAKDQAGKPRGPTVDLGEELARSLSAPIEFLVVPNSGQLVEALERESIDVAFMPIDDERKKRIDFGPSYFLIESTCLVKDNSQFKVTSDLNRLGVRVAGITNTTTIRNAMRVLGAATVFPVSSVSEAMDRLRDGDADAVALSRDVLLAYQRKIQGTRILDGNLHTTGVGIAVPKGRPIALLYATAFLENAKASGFVRRSFDQAGLHSDVVAPAEAAK